eukprot:TRINITY_DN46883_c0_g1_i1.p1 TRINITY_DN46883_c0_g1~~TRINITY_DN46883_c0_g1_i1.p1  ORF type:complete len:721 (+),score=127.75 TRINITY_DN46883_c0_g1_i1:76-2238(+)
MTRKQRKQKARLQDRVKRHAPDQKDSAGKQQPRKLRRLEAAPTPHTSTASQAAVTADDAAEELVGSLNLPVAERAIQWYQRGSSKVGGDVSLQPLRKALFEAVRPLLEARAATYEDSAKQTKTQRRQLLGKQVAAMTSMRASRSSPDVGDGTGAVCDMHKEELEEAVRDLGKLSAHGPGALAARACKKLRAALHPLVESHLQETKSSPTYRVSCLLQHRPRWPEALKLISDMRQSGVEGRPRLGAYQRWIRELDIAEGDGEELAMLDAILRLAGGYSPRRSVAAASGGAKGATIQRAQLLTVEAARSDAVEGPGTKASTEAADKNDKGADGTVSVASQLLGLVKERREATAAATAAIEAASAFSPIARELGHERLPPSKFDVVIHACSSVVALKPSIGAPLQVQPQAIRDARGAVLLSNILSLDECDQLCRAGEIVGFSEDVPAAADPSRVSEFARNATLLVDETESELLLDRLRPHLPPVVGDSSATLVSVNRRWRLQRYETGNLDRKHLDVASPSCSSRVGHAGQKEYERDAGGPSIRSRLTCLIFLNDHFQGGETTFYTPAPDEEQVLRACPVKPSAGAAVLIPHAEGAALCYEASTKLVGRQYILRTEILYRTTENFAAQKEAARIRGLKRQLGVTDSKADDAHAQGDANRAEGEQSEDMDRDCSEDGVDASGPSALPSKDVISPTKGKPHASRASKQLGKKAGKKCKKHLYPGGQ